MSNVYSEGDRVRVVTKDGGEYIGYITTAEEYYFTLSGCPPELEYMLEDFSVMNHGFCYEDVELRPVSDG